MKINVSVTAMLVLVTLASANAGAVNMTWTPGGYTATDWNSPPTADNGVLVSTVTPSTMSVSMTTNPNNGELGALYFDGGFTGSGLLLSQQLTLNFDITVDNQPFPATAQPKNLDLSLIGGTGNDGTAGLMLGMNIASNVPGPATPWAFRFALAPTTATGGVFAMRDGGATNNSNLKAFGTYAVGSTYHVALDANYTTGLLDAYIDGTLAMSGFKFADGGSNVWTSEVFIHLNGESGTANSVSINHFTASVPDAASTLLLLGGALGALSGFVPRWKKR